MQTLATEFDRACRNVSIHGDKAERAANAHKEVRALLEADETLKEWGINTILIGSYARLTSRYPGKDVDVFLRFTNLSVRHDPQKIYNEVERVLVAEYGLKTPLSNGRVTQQARSLKIDFDDDADSYSDLSFHVDAVPAVPWGDHWGIPNRNRDVWDNDEKRWIKTNPVQFAIDTNVLSTSTTSPSVGASNAYRPTVRLLRQVRHIHLAEQRPGGLFTEVAAYYAWRDELVSGDSWAELLTSTLEQVAKIFDVAAVSGLKDPILHTPMKPALESWQWSTAASSMRSLAERAREALNAEKCLAAKIWREILGTNDRGQVLPLPEGCDANGFPISSISAVSAVGSNEPRGFASSPVATCC